MSPKIIAIYLTVFIASVGITKLIRYYSLKRNFLDIPNERSSHVVAVPQGGGIAIVVLSIIGVLSLFMTGLLSLSLFVTLMTALLLLSVVGWFDDKYGLSIHFRLLAQLIVTAVSLYFIGGINNINIINFDLDLSMIAYLLGILWVVGFINMYNFMDGIDGFIGLHSVISGIFIAIWLFFFNETGLTLFCVILSAANLGFLVWNIAPAKIFCGDVGSTTLGGLFAILGLYLHNENGMSIVFYSGLFAFFMIDSSVTILKRALRGEKIWLPHREHFYQLLSIKYKSHSVVSLGVAFFSLVIGSVLTYYMWKFYVNY